MGLADGSERAMRTSRRRLLAGAAVLCLAHPGRSVGVGEPFVEARIRMLSEIESDFRATAASTGFARLDPAVRAALAKVPRDRFVPAEQAARAYANRPLSIGHGQTISQPFVVALMTQLIEPQPNHRVLEIGTGSGYQAAVLAELVERVYTIEIVRPLAEQADELLRELGYTNIETRAGDGYRGWPQAAPFDAILVTAAPDEMPQPLIDQLAPGGSLVAPIGPRSGIQNLLLMRKEADGRTVSRNLLPVRFVPLTRES